MNEIPLIPHEQDVSEAIGRLVAFALERGMLEPLDAGSARNSLLDLYGLAAPAAGSEELPSWEQGLLDAPNDADRAKLAAGLPAAGAEAPELLRPLLDYAAASGMIRDSATERDLLDARLMGLLMPRPSETHARFRAAAAERGIRQATDEFYRLNIDANYIRLDRVALNMNWIHPTAYGPLEMTVNLSKPEKDPAEIAMLRSMPPSAYPKCLLCKENMGYAGRADHPARQNHRILPLRLSGESWFLQYSPYVYYEEHCIVFRAEHSPMSISHRTFGRLLEFTEQIPHYFVGSNADLPIVGGSILSHDHFQGGRHVFPMEEAPVEESFSHSSRPDISYGIVRWPMSVLRLAGRDRRQLAEAASDVLDAWRGFSDPEAEIHAYTEADGARTPHNTITPVARRREDGVYELDLVLRNNRTSEEHPEGIFHPHRHLHHLKRENIGLIEVMGLAVLPGRLKAEMEIIAACLSGSLQWNDVAAGADGAAMAPHDRWFAELQHQWGKTMDREAAMKAVLDSAGDKFLQVLTDAGVYKRTAEGRAAFKRFAAAAELQPVNG